METFSGTVQTPLGADERVLEKEAMERILSSALVESRLSEPLVECQLPEASISSAGLSSAMTVTQPLAMMPQPPPMASLVDKTRVAHDKCGLCAFYDARLALLIGRLDKEAQMLRQETRTALAQHRKQMAEERAELFEEE